jgi:hypothetical protein
MKSDKPKVKASKPLSIRKVIKAIDGFGVPI